MDEDEALGFDKEEGKVMEDGESCYTIASHLKSNYKINKSNTKAYYGSDVDDQSSDSANSNP